MSSSGPRQAAYRLGVLKGDGIGPEVVPVAVDLARV